MTLCLCCIGIVEINLLSSVWNRENLPTSMSRDTVSLESTEKTQPQKAWEGGGRGAATCRLPFDWHGIDRDRENKNALVPPLQLDPRILGSSTDYM